MPILSATLLARKLAEDRAMTITITFQDNTTLVCTGCRDLSDDGSWLRFTGTGEDGNEAKFNVNLAFVKFYSVIYP